MQKFKLVSNFKPRGDQPKAIRQLVKGLKAGNRYQTLLGVTGSGKSLDGEEPLLIYSKDQFGNLIPEIVKIGEFIDDLFLKEQRKKVSKNGTQICPPPEEYYVLSFSPKKCKQELKPVTAFIRHRAPSSMFLVKTSCGRETLVTGDHNFWVMRNGKMTLISTKEIQANDFLPLPLFIPSSNKDLRFINLLEALKNEKVFVESNSLIMKLIERYGKKKILKVFSKYYKHADAKLFSISNNIKGCRFPIKKLLGILKELNYNPSEQDLAKMQIFSRRKNYKLIAKLPISDELISLMGYFLAEGHASERYFLLTCFDEKLRVEIIRILKILGIDYSVRKNSDFQISSKLYSTLFGVLLGRTSRDKKLPYFWGRLSQRQLGLLLRAYYEGDGWVEKEGVVCCSTASQQLISDLAYALLRFGIWARSRKVWKRATDTKHEGDWYYQLSISGQDNLKKFDAEIGFVSKRKTARLREELGKSPGSNVDLFFGLGTDLRKIRQLLDMSQKQIAIPSQISRSMVSLIESGSRHPTRATFLRLAKTIWERVDELKGVDRSSYDLIQRFVKMINLRWTKIVSVEKVTYKKRYVYDISVADNETFLAGKGGVFLHNTFTMANVVEAVQRPTLVISPNKTLAAQLCQEFRIFFPHNAVEYFVSYYDYYQPEAYIPHTDTYIEKDASINEELDRLRHEATMALLTRRDVIVVASVSCIYNLGTPGDYLRAAIPLRIGESCDREELIKKLISVKYERNDYELKRGRFRVRGEIIEILPAYEKNLLRIELDGERIAKLTELEPVSGKKIAERDYVAIFPGTHYLTFEDRLEAGIQSIQKELAWRLEELRKRNKLVEAQRLEQRTKYDIEMIREMGYCPGIENYSRHFDGRQPGEPPATLLDYFPEDALVFIDESHVTIPQLHGMYEGDRSRKETLIEFGFRLPSALDNRPLKFDEFEKRIKQAIFVSATPGPFERENSEQIVEQIIRPTGLVDPAVEVRKAEGQVEDLIKEIEKRVERKERVLVTTLTKRMAEDLAEYLNEAGIRVRYLHSDVETLDRIEILRGLRLGEFDVLVGINLLREGLDLPEVSLVAILDADKEGFLRGETSLIQTIGRAARNVNGTVILYAEKETDSMKRAIKETNRRRKLQIEFNKKHHITPQTIVKEVHDITERIRESKLAEIKRLKEFVPRDEVPDLIRALEDEMQMAATELNFELAAEIRDRIKELKKAFGIK